MSADTPAPGNPTSRALPTLISSYQELTANMTQEDFARRFKQPFLVLARSAALKTAIRSAGPQGLEGDFTAVAAITEGEEVPAYVCPVVKQDKSRVEPAITLGRAMTNDIIVPVASVSAEHCQFIPPEKSGGTWSCRDLGSKNGSFIDGARMIPGQPYPLQSGMHLDLARDVKGWVFSATEFWALLRDRPRLDAMFER